MKQIELKITLTDEEVGKLLRYIKYSDGGFQRFIRKILLKPLEEAGLK